MYFVYLIQCGDDSIYTGIATDVTQRFEKHKNKNGGHCTASRGTKK
ncbi:MAG: GIY-YIG nuclease family protein [Candidatus Nealsonbacteria bacterium DGGOD1a]|nr:MAG: GIY-YIG nuclease family protein [Candidatus Nealsonbacteria bacterium DGGOD1a]